MSLTLLGQPKIRRHLVFDVTNFQVVREASEIVGDVVEIVDANEAFTLKLDFRGSGTEWRNICDDARREFNVHFDAEGIGPWPHQEYHLGNATGNLIPRKYNYDVEFTAQIPTPGVYRLSAMVTFPRWEGVLGFAEGLVIQVSPLEQ